MSPLRSVPMSSFIVAAGCSTWCSNGLISASSTGTERTGSDMLMAWVAPVARDPDANAEELPVSPANRDDISFSAAVITETCHRLYGLDAQFLLRSRQEGQQLLDILRLTQPADGAHHHAQRARWRGEQHFDQSRQRALVADLGQGIHRAFAHPPVLVLGGLDEQAHRALVLGLIQDLDGAAADVIVLVARQLQHRIDDLRT